MTIFVKPFFCGIVPAPNPSHVYREGQVLLYSGDFVPTPLFTKIIKRESVDVDKGL